MQTGSFKQNGRYWWFKYREDVLEHGVKVRKDRQIKLALIADHPAKHDGSAPESVRSMAVKYTAPINAKESTPLSGDKMLAFLEMFLAHGEGGQGKKLATSTLRNYNDLFKIAKPFIPDMELRQVEAHHIDKMLRDIAENDDANGGRRAHTTYVNLKNSLLNSAFKYATRRGLIKVNPVREAAVPEGKESDTYAITLEEFSEMVKALDKEGTDKTHTAVAALFVLMFTGVRMEELQGLRWEDYDSKTGVLNIQRAIIDGEEKETKTKGSKAPVPVVKVVADRLAAHLKSNSGDGYMFHDETGHPMWFANFAQRQITPILKANKLEWHGYHAFRRGLATELEGIGCPTNISDRITRHSPKDKSVRTKHYVKAHATQVLENSREWLKKVEARYLKMVSYNRSVR
jgi:integrase